ncbi:LOW QUALITY PROTEIN: hypothetical protein MKX08_001973 [Trichoderma sp. CBMAI-0020]|nr:LOW QUALITY PROTEIN: hypothetical protein MKX08_001973 [Trichoderma sp. CBMAI-0020]
MAEMHQDKDVGRYWDFKEKVAQCCDSIIVKEPISESDQALETAIANLHQEVNEGLQSHTDEGAELLGAQHRSLLQGNP